MALDICLVHSPCSKLDDDRLEPPLGLLYIASALQIEGHRVRVADLAGVTECDAAAAIPDRFEVYGFSTYSVTHQLTAELAAAVRARNPNALFIAGGPHATALPEQVVHAGFDVVVTGEGELAMQRIVRQLAAGQQPPALLAGEPADPLDALPFPAYDLVDVGSYHRCVDGERSLSLLSSRGCPYPCSFCNSNIMGSGRPLRYRSASNVAAEVRQLKARYGIRHFRFQDDLFTANVRRLRELTLLLREERIVYRCFSRVTGFAETVARLLVDSGCRHVSFGVESGSPSLLARHAMNKRQSPEQITTALHHAARAGLKTRIYLIVGFPGETPETIAETLALVKRCPWDEFMVYPLIAYPGTPIHDRPQDFGIVGIDRDYSQYVQIGRERGAGFTIRTAAFDEQQVRCWREQVIAELLADGRTWAGASNDFK